MENSMQTLLYKIGELQKNRLSSKQKSKDEEKTLMCSAY